MARLCILVCQMEDEHNPEQMTELERILVPDVEDAAAREPTSLDDLETQALDIGRQVSQSLLQQQWHLLDQRLVARYQALFPPRHGQA